MNSKASNYQVVGPGRVDRANRATLPQDVLVATSVRRGGQKPPHAAAMRCNAVDLRMAEEYCGLGGQVLPGIGNDNGGAS